MSKWTHPNGDTITTEGTKYTVTTRGTERRADVGRWTLSARDWILSDIKAGYYQGFKEVMS